VRQELSGGEPEQVANEIDGMWAAHAGYALAAIKRFSGAGKFTRWHAVEALTRN
jgi:hypothetical protein